MPFKPAPTRGSAPFDKSKKPAFRDASQATNARDINAIGTYVSTNGVLRSVKKAMQAAKGGNFILSSADFRAETDSRIKQTRLQQPLELNEGYADIFIIQYNSGGFVNWTIANGGTGATDDTGYSIGYDSAGNMLAVGGFVSNVLKIRDRTGKQVFALTNPGGSSIGCGYVIKYDSNGTPLWASRCYAGNYPDVATDSSNNIYIVINIGYPNNGISSISNADGTLFANTANYPTSSAGTHIVKYNSAGVVQWVGRIDGGGNNDNGAAVCVDPSGNVNTCGRFLTDLNINNGDGTLFSPTTGYAEGTGLYIVQYTSAGNANWVAEMHATGGSWPWAAAITTDSSGNINVGGYYTYGALKLYNKNNGTLFSTSLAGPPGATPNSFVVQYSSAGNVNWGARITCNFGGQNPDYGTTINDCDTDTLGNIIVCGSFAGGFLQLDNADGSTRRTGNIAVTSASSNGTQTTYTTTSAHGFYIGQVVTIGGTTNGNHNVSNVVITSVPTGTTFTIASTVANGQTSTGGTMSSQLGSYTQSGFVAKYNSLGVLQWVNIQLSDGTRNDTAAMTVSIDRANNNINISGFFSSNILTFSNANGSVFGTTLINSNPSREVFLVQYTPDGVVNWISRAGKPGGETVFGSDTDANGNFTITGSTAGNVTSYDKTGLPASPNVYVPL
jgi:hypothetical protein